MRADCHIHMLLDGVDFRAAIASHRASPAEGVIRQRLARYRELGYTYLRDGGDRWGAALKARELAEEYGITYKAPAFPIHKKGHYGGFIGRGFETPEEYRELIRENRKKQGDFVKLMISGIMDFDCRGRLMGDPLPEAAVKELIHIAHEEGFSVMVHGNGGDTVLAAAAAGAESIEHGAYLHKEALWAMAEAGTVWVPTLATIGNLRGTGRFQEEEVRAILQTAQENVAAYAAIGGLLAPGSDAGAFAVPHGTGGLGEYALFQEILGEDCGEFLARGIARLRERF